jgi:hypothetical protein
MRALWVAPVLLVLVPMPWLAPKLQVCTGLQVKSMPRTLWVLLSV